MGRLAPGMQGSHSLIDGPPAIVREAMPLLSWVRETSIETERIEKDAAKKREELAEVTKTVESSGEFADVEEAKEVLRLAKERALDCEPVEKAKVALKLKKSALRQVAAARLAAALKKEIAAKEQMVLERDRELRRAGATGKVPKAESPLVPDVPPAKDGKAAAAGGD